MSPTRSSRKIVRYYTHLIGTHESREFSPSVAVGDAKANREYSELTEIDAL